MFGKQVTKRTTIVLGYEHNTFLTGNTGSEDWTVLHAGIKDPFSNGTDTNNCLFCCLRCQL